MDWELSKLTLLIKLIKGISCQTEIYVSEVAATRNQTNHQQTNQNSLRDSLKIVLLQSERNGAYLRGSPQDFLSVSWHLTKARWSAEGCRARGLEAVLLNANQSLWRHLIPKIFSPFLSSHLYCFFVCVRRKWTLGATRVEQMWGNWWKRQG